MQNVDEELRRKFESDWVSGTPGKLADYLPPKDSDDYLATLEELVCIDMEFRWDDIDEKTEFGNDALFDFSSVANPSTNIPKSTLTGRPLPVLETYLNHFPELNHPACVQRLIDQEILVRGATPYPPKPDEYAQRFPDLGLAQSILKRRISALPTRAFEKERRSGGSGELPREFGDYLLLELLGRGGMGSVFRAKHSTTNRIVALKLADLGSFSPENRIEVSRRLTTEIQAAAGLKDDHLVPVYDVGSVGTATFYTMPILDSDLAGEIRGGPLEPRTAAKFIADAASGLEVAHQNGLLHRDIKPHNLMLDKKNDRVMVADFGLARTQSTNSDLTRTGNLLGTPPYMSPEQIRNAQSVDARADVYSMGATLYHLITGRPPLTAAEPTETIRQVLQDDPLSPRELNPSIDQDLETICLKCLRKEPESRYASAGELSTDLRRYLRDEPILARPLGTAGRLIRWRKRNPTLAAAFATLVLATIAISGLSYLTYRENQSFLSGLNQGAESIDDLFAFLDSTELFDQPGNEAPKRMLLERSIKHYESFIELAGDHPELAAGNYRAQVQLADLLLEIEGPEPTAARVRRVIDRHAGLPKGIRNQPKVRAALGDAWNLLGKSQRFLRKEQDSLDAFSEAAKIRKSLVDAHPDSIEYARKYANAMMNEGLVLSARKRLDEARAIQLSAQEVREKLIERDPTNLAVLRDVGQGQFNLARLEMLRERWPKALLRLEAATEQFKRISRLQVNDALIWRRLVECELARCEVPLMIGEVTPKQASKMAQSYATAMEYLRLLVQLSANNRTYRIELIDLCHQASELALRIDGPDAIERATNGWEIVKDQLLVHFDDSDQQPDIAWRRVEHLGIGAMIDIVGNRKDDAIKSIAVALEALDAFREKFGDSGTSDIIEWGLLRQTLKSIEPELL